MTAKILCLGRKYGRLSDDANLTRIRELIQKFKISISGISDAKDLRELITDMIPALENNNVIFFLISKEDYLRTKNTMLRAMGVQIIAHPAVLRAISISTRDVIPQNDVEEHAAMPKGATVFLTDDGFYSGFAFSEGEQHIIMLPYDDDICRNLIDGFVKQYFLKYINKGKITKVIGMFGVGRTEVQTALDEIFFNNSFCEYTIKDYGGELQVTITASFIDDGDVKSVFEQKIKDVSTRFKKNVYGINQPRLAELAVHSLKASGFDVSVVINPGAKNLISKLAIVPEYSAFFKFVEAEIEKGAQQPNDYAARLANAAHINSGSDFGAAITNMFSTDTNGEKICVMYIALADGKQVWVRKLYSKTADNVGEILNSASACLLELIYRKSEEYLNSLLIAPPVTNDEKSAAAVTVEAQDEEPEPKFDIYAAYLAAAKGQTETESQPQPSATPEVSTASIPTQQLPLQEATPSYYAAPQYEPEMDDFRQSTPEQSAYGIPQQQYTMPDYTYPPVQQYSQPEPVLPPQQIYAPQPQYSQPSPPVYTAPVQPPQPSYVDLAFEEYSRRQTQSRTVQPEAAPEEDVFTPRNIERYSRQPQPQPRPQPPQQPVSQQQTSATAPAIEQHERRQPQPRYRRPLPPKEGEGLYGYRGSVTQVDGTDEEEKAARHVNAGFAEYMNSLKQEEPETPNVEETEPVDTKKRRRRKKN